MRSSQLSNNTQQVPLKLSITLIWSSLQVIFPLINNKHRHSRRYRHWWINLEEAPQLIQSKIWTPPLVLYQISGSNPQLLSCLLNQTQPSRSFRNSRAGSTTHRASNSSSNSIMKLVSILWIHLFSPLIGTLNTSNSRYLVTNRWTSNSNSASRTNK